jgi:hypothetical protein
VPGQSRRVNHYRIVEPYEEVSNFRIHLKRIADSHVEDNMMAIENNGI